MKLRFINFIVSILAVVGLVSCEEREYPGDRDDVITFEQVYSDGPVKYIYASPDYTCAAKMHSIDASADSSRLVLKCTNHDSIFIQGLSGGGVIMDGDLECVEKGKWYRSRQGKWEVWTEGPDKLVFDFQRSNLTPDAQQWGMSGGLLIGGVTAKGSELTNIHITRYLVRHDAL